MKEYLKKHYPLGLSFWTPVLLMLGYFIYRGFYPFGSSSVLTVDLGQQSTFLLIFAIPCCILRVNYFTHFQKP